MLEATSNKGAAMVIGGSGGLGKAVCELLAQEWDSLFFTYNNNFDAAKALQEKLSSQCSVSFGQMDLRSKESIDACFLEADKTVGEIGTVIFASGAHIDQPYVSAIEQSAWDEVLDIELSGFTRIVKATLPRFHKQGHGNIVSVVSVANYFFPPGDALSAVPKAAIEVLCRAIAKEEGRYGIRANSVAPGIINAGLGTEFQETLFTPEIWQQQKNRVPLKRFGEGKEVAEAVTFLASTRASYITGQTIIVDGGLQL